MPSRRKFSDVFNEETSSGVALKNKALKKLIFNLLDKSDSSSITELSKELNISVPKTTSLINELIEDRLISDYGKVDSTGGRKASMYGLVAEACFFLGVDVKKYYVNIGLMDFKKHLISQKLRLPFRLENTQASLNQLINLINQFIKDAPVKKDKILSMGINLSGRINQTKGYSYSFSIFRRSLYLRLLKIKQVSKPIWKTIPAQWHMANLCAEKLAQKRMCCL